MIPIPGKAHPKNARRMLTKSKSVYSWQKKEIKRYCGDSEISPPPTLHAEYHKMVCLLLQIIMPIENSESEN